MLKYTEKQTGSQEPSGSESRPRGSMLVEVTVTKEPCLDRTESISRSNSTDSVKDRNDKDEEESSVAFSGSGQSVDTHHEVFGDSDEEDQAFTEDEEEALPFSMPRVIQFDPHKEISKTKQAKISKHVATHVVAETCTTVKSTTHEAPNSSDDEKSVETSDSKLEELAVIQAANAFGSVTQHFSVNNEGDDGQPRRRGSLLRSSGARGRGGTTNPQMKILHQMQTCVHSKSRSSFRSNSTKCDDATESENQSRSTATILTRSDHYSLIPSVNGVRGSVHGRQQQSLVDKLRRGSMASSLLSGESLGWDDDSYNSDDPPPCPRTEHNMTLLHRNESNLTEN